MASPNGVTGVPLPNSSYLDKGYGVNSTPKSHFATAEEVAPPHVNSRFTEDWDASVRGESIMDGSAQQSDSAMLHAEPQVPSRGGTLKKKASLKRGSSLRRSGSRRSSKAGSVRSLAFQTSGDEDEMHSAFYSPVPTTGNPTEILANRFQAWRKVLKDLITYFREVQASYDHKAKSLLKVSNIINNTVAPPMFLASGGIDDAIQMLRGYHKTAIVEANKSRDIENDVIMALTGLRSDLSQKIKEIKNLSGDFKNSVDKEMEATRRIVNQLQEGLGHSDVDPAAMTGRQDPYLLKLAVDRQVERQVDEENYLHQAYLNLEASGRELEAIVVGEIQKSFNALTGILRREADSAYHTLEELRTGPIAMPKDHEWNAFIDKDEHFVDPRLPVREAQYISYPGRDNELAQEVRAGLLERKGKYLKSYTAGWYVLSPTHLHEFKSADKAQAPIMSLYLPEQKLGSHSNQGSSSNKFMLKGRQTGSMHRGHSWVFRAESYETMMAWYHDVQALTEKSPQERNAFVRQHARSISGTSQKAGSVSSDGIMDEEDEEPFSTNASAVIAQGSKPEFVHSRPSGGRFPSELSIQRGLQAPLSPSSGSSGYGEQDHGVVTTPDETTANLGRFYGGGDDVHSPNHTSMVNQYARDDNVNPYTLEPLSKSHHQTNDHFFASNGAIANVAGAPFEKSSVEADHNHGGNNSTSSSNIKQQEILAAPEASTIDALDVRENHEQHSSPETAQLITPKTKYPVLFRAEDGSSEHEVDQASIVAKPTLSSFTVASTPSIQSPRSKYATEQARQSEYSVSQLHVPGEYPKPSVV